MRKTILCTMILLLVGCSLAPDYTRPTVEANNAWKDNLWLADTIDQEWWKTFGSTELDGLIATAITRNTDIAASLSRIDQARAQAKIAGAALYPGVDASGGYSLSDGENASSRRSWDVGASISYELDLWQKNMNTKRAAIYGVNATLYNQAALSLVVTSDTVQRYAEILMLKERARLLNENIAIFKDTLGIVQARFDEGSASGLEVAQQKATLANAQASLASLRQQKTITENALAVLLGSAPQDFKADFDKTLTQLTIPSVSPLQPTTLLERRPDIRAQEENLKAANANIGVARAALFPGASLGLSTGLIANPATATPVWTANAAASVIQRVFAGGALRGQVKLSQARKAELIETYRTTVLVAYKEVQDALVSVDATRQRESALQAALGESRTAYAIAKDRYLNGASDFLSLLDAQRSLLQAQENNILVRLERLNAAVLLYKALGGGWQSS